MMWNWYAHDAGWGGWLGFMFMIVFVVAAVVAIVYLVRYLAPPQPMPAHASPQETAAARTPRPESPHDILKRRYAAGEIDRDEYLQKLGDL